jgi:hypothetical protein
MKKGECRSSGHGTVARFAKLFEGLFELIGKGLVEIIGQAPPRSGIFPKIVI